MLKELLKEENASGDFGAVYMILVFAIAALALILVAKPIYNNSQEAIPKNIKK